jgi:hypothetical protein
MRSHIHQLGVSGTSIAMDWQAVGCVYVGYGVGIDDIRAAQRPSP